MTTATITSKGQTTIPKEIRNKLKLHPGDKVDFILGADGTVILRPVSIDVRDLYGFMHKPGQRAVTLEEMEQSIIAGAKESMK